MTKNVKGITVLVTGSAEGIGFSIVDSFIQNGAKFAIILDINEQKGEQAVKILNSKYGDNRVVFFKCDVTKDLEVIFNKVTSKCGYVDLVINNAGIANEKIFRKTIDLNITAMIDCSMKFYDLMRKDRGGKGGSIINISSIYGYKIVPYVPCYHASKFAVIGFSKSLGHKTNFDRTGVRVITLCPGCTHTHLSQNVEVREDEFLPKFIEEIKSLDWQSPDFVGRCAVDIYKQAESGEVWLVEGERPAEKLSI